MPTALGGFRVTLPGADDIYHLIPDSAYPQAERQRRRADRRRRIEESPTPEIVRGVTSILQTIDDVQDAFVTLSLLTRFAVPYVPRLAPFARAIATAADVINIANITRSLGIFGGTGKGSYYRQLATMPGSYASRLNNTLRTGRVAPTVGELLQVLQTTDLLYGTGMQLGAVMGLPIDLAFLAARGGTLDVPLDSLLALATLAPVFLSASPYIQLASLAAGFALSALPELSGQTISIPLPRLLPTNPDLAPYVQDAPAFLETFTAYETADQALTDISYLDGLGQELTPTEHSLIELTRYQALALLALPAAAAPGGILQPESHPPLNKRQELPRRPLQWLRENPSHPNAIATASLLGQAWHTLALSLEPPTSLDPPQWLPEAIDGGRSIELGRELPRTLPQT